MQRSACQIFVAILLAASLSGQEKKGPILRVSCTSNKRIYAGHDAVDLTVTLESEDEGFGLPILTTADGGFSVTECRSRST